MTISLLLTPIVAVTPCGENLHAGDSNQGELNRSKIIVGDKLFLIFRILHFCFDVLGFYGFSWLLSE